MTQLLGSVGLVQGTYKINGWLRLIPLLDSLRRHLEPPKLLGKKMKTTKQYFVDNYHRFQCYDVPEYYGKHKDLIILHESQVNCDNINNQKRKEKSISSRSTKLQMSFSRTESSLGEPINFNCKIPVVELRPDGKYDLVDGFGREGTIFSMGEYYIFQLIKFKNERTKIEFMSYMNEPPPQQKNGKNSLYENTLKMIQQKMIDPDIKSVQESLRMSKPHIEKTEMEQLSKLIMENFGTPQPESDIILWDNKTIQKNWVDKHWSDRKLHDFDLKKYGFGKNPNVIKGQKYHHVVIKNGYTKRKLINSILKYQGEGIVTKFIFHVDGVPTKTKLNQKRRVMMKDFVKVLKSLSKFFGRRPSKYNHFFEFLGFIPQHEEETITELVKMKMKI